MSANASGPGSAAELIGKIREGMVPRSVRLFAAQGLVPVSREELIRILALVAADGDEEISTTAKASLAEFTSDALIGVLRTEAVDSVEVDLLCRCRDDEKLWMEVVRHPKTANETLRWLARVGGLATQSTIITNQARIFGCLEILEDLRANPNPGQEILRRVREFEEEFLEKAIVWATAEETKEEVVQGPSIEDALEQLRALGMQIPPTELAGEKLPEPGEDEPKDSRDAFVRIAMMTTFEKVMCALKGTRDERAILVKDRSALVLRAVMNSPRLNESDVEMIAGNRSANPEAFRMIAKKAKWLRRYSIMRNLLFNPKVPPGVALQFVRRLSQRDLMLLSKDRNVSDAVRKVAKMAAQEHG
jgi:hypothetical protein